MSPQEKTVMLGVLLLIALIAGMDLVNDAGEGVARVHLLGEGIIAFAALLGVFHLIRGSYQLRHRLSDERTNFSNFRKEAASWQLETKKYLLGLSKAIDEQLSKWNLSVAEKEVAFLLLKGMSLKEIAAIRGTAEKTARIQSIAIYSKAGLSGRSELSAFFLEDLLLPHKD